MPPFRRVEAEHAGATALGILVPPGPRTYVILRPRSMDWDLLPARWNGDARQPPTFCLFERDEAARLAKQLLKALDEAVHQGANPVQTLGDADGRRFQVWVRSGEFVWIICRRTPGVSYQPAVFVSHAEALREAECLTPIVWPGIDAGQEVYFNTQRFAT